MLRETDPLQQLLEAGIGFELIEARIDVQQNEAALAAAKLADADGAGAYPPDAGCRRVTVGAHLVCRGVRRRGLTVNNV